MFIKTVDTVAREAVKGPEWDLRPRRGPRVHQTIAIATTTRFQPVQTGSNPVVISRNMQWRIQGRGSERIALSILIFFRLILNLTPIFFA